MGIDRKALLKQMAAIEQVRGAGFWKPKEGDTRFRLLYGWTGSDTYFVDVATHYNVGPKKRAITCSKYTSQLTKKSKGNCWLCSVALELGSGDAEAKALARDLKPQTRYLMNVYLRPTEAEPGGLKIAQFPKGVHDTIFKFIMDEEIGDITDPQTGMDIKLTRTGTNLDTKYTVIVIPKETPLHKSEEEAEKILHDRPDLTKFMKLLSPKQMEAVFSGEDAEDEEAAEEGDDDEEKAEAPATVKKTAKKPAPAPVEEEEEESNDDDTEEPEEESNDEAESDDDDDADDSTPVNVKKVAAAPAKADPKAALAAMRAKLSKK